MCCGCWCCFSIYCWCWYCCFYCCCGWGCYDCCCCCSVDDATVVAATVIVVGAAVAIYAILLVESHFRANRHLCVDVACRASAEIIVDGRRVHFDARGVWVAVGARVVDVAAGASANDDAAACGTGKGTICSLCSGWGRVHEHSQHARACSRWWTVYVCIRV